MGGYEGEIVVWDPESGKIAKTLKAFSGRIEAIHFGPNGKLLAASHREQGVKIWSVPRSGD